jgi:hypothetical protein
METADSKQLLASQTASFGKPLHREALRKLSMPEKVRIVVELQKIAAPILRARGESPFIWQIKQR